MTLGIDGGPRRERTRPKWLGWTLDVVLALRTMQEVGDRL